MGAWSTLLLLGHVLVLSNAVCPNIKSRADWGARPPNSAVNEMKTPVPYIVVHHGGSKVYCTTEEQCAKIVRSYQNYHMDVNKWEDIGYSFVIGEDGNVYTGRGWNKQGAHAPTYNSRSIGICIIGDFTDRPPNRAALDTLKKLMDCGVELGYVQEDYKLIGHRQSLASSTVCPGDMLFKEIKTWPHWTSQPTNQKSTS